MKKVKNFLTAFAVVLAVGGAFANGHFFTVVGWAKNPDTGICVSGVVADDCAINNPKATCKFSIEGVPTDAYDNFADCGTQTGPKLLKHLN